MVAAFKVPTLSSNPSTREGFINTNLKDFRFLVVQPQRMGSKRSKNHIFLYFFLGKTTKTFISPDWGFLSKF